MKHIKCFLFLIDTKSDFNANVLWLKYRTLKEGGPTHVEQNKQKMKIGIFHPHCFCLEHDQKNFIEFIFKGFSFDFNTVSNLDANTSYMETEMVKINISIFTKQ